MLTCLKHDQLKIKEIDLFCLTWKWINECVLSSSSTKKTLITTMTRKRRSEKIKKKKPTCKKKLKKKSSMTLNNRKLNWNHDLIGVGFKKAAYLDGLNAKIKTESCFLRKIDIVRNLIKNIRFALISPSDIVDRVQTINSLMLNDACLRKLVLNALNYHLMPNLHHQEEKNDTDLNLNIRSSIKCVLAIGGREINPNPSLNDACYLLTEFAESSKTTVTLHNRANSSNIVKSTLTALPFPLSHMQTVVVGNFLYILGGCVSQCAHGESAVSSAFRFDPRLAKWTSIAPMLEKRAYFYASSMVISDLSQENTK
jgi:hypothetical protein